MGRGLRELSQNRWPIEKGTIMKQSILKLSLAVGLVMDAASASGSTPGSIYVYVPDVDGAYRRALERGAISVAGPEDKPYQERQAGVRDSFGNTWWISTYRG